MPRMGYGQRALIPLLVEHGVRTVVVPLHYLHDSPQLSLLPRRDRLGRVFDPCTQMRQIPQNLRAPRFRALAFGDNPQPYDPERSRLSDQELVELALGPLDAQRSRGGTLLLSTFHVAGPVGTRGREVELALAGVAVKHFREQRVDEPPPYAANGVRRELYVTIAIESNALMSAGARRALADAYLALGADGIWVKIANFHERAGPASIRAGGAFLAALREGGVPVVCCGPGQLYLALLSDEVSASIGLSESERFAAPKALCRARERGRTAGRTRMAYNSTLQRSFRVGSQEAKRAFALAGCDCGEHPPHRSPDGSTVARHAAVVRAREAHRALIGTCAQRRERLLAASADASWRAAEGELPGAQNVLGGYRALFDGIADAGAELAA